MRKTLNNWKHYWQEDFIEEKVNSKVSCLSFVSIAMKLVILLQDVHRRRLTKKEESTKKKKEDDGKDYRDKGKNSCYIVEEETSGEHDDEVVYVAIKDESDEDVVTALVTCVNKNDRWIIDSGCSHHMIGDKSKFFTLNYYDGNSVRFGNDAPCLIKEKVPSNS